MKYLLSLLAMLIAIECTHAQNIFPSNGNVGIGTNSPVTPMDIKGNLTLENTQNVPNAGVMIHFTGLNTTDFGPTIKSSLFLAGAHTYTSLTLSSYWDGYKNELTLINGNAGIGTGSPDATLAVNGNIHTQEVKVDMTGWPDYVFKPSYKLPTLSAVKNYIDQKQHLPEMPSEAEVAKNGVNLGEMVKLQTKKIEELTLYLIEKEEQISDQNKKLADQQKRMDQLQSQLETLAKEIHQNQ